MDSLRIKGDGRRGWGGGEVEKRDREPGDQPKARSPLAAESRPGREGHFRCRSGAPPAHFLEPDVV